MVEVSELRKFDLFEAFSDAQLEKIAGVTQRKSYKANGRVYESGEPARYLFVVEKGLVSLREIKPEDQIGIAFEMRQRGELFGTACFTDQRFYTLTGVCLEDSDVLAVDADKLLEMCAADPELGYKLMKKITQVYFERYKVAKRQLHEMVKTPSIITALPG
ncbi:MAG TPA: cyclic nucleotide-binding domain-containing protein [Syntrophobacteraceae bacterium]|nr:cyclic nucleotide-binding domain-containing protein [Syntrophobacteraceae bacterium]